MMRLGKMLSVGVAEHAPAEEPVPPQSEAQSEQQPEQQPEPADAAVNDSREAAAALVRP